ncbi:MAG: hypothetical protein Q7U09_00270 [Hydrogenophaga sp.]|nr:hypothetical protein [Hydrogenophaga sp.]
MTFPSPRLGHQTPPVLKWLLNEHAAKRGELAMSRRRIQELETAIQALNQNLAIASSELRGLLAGLAGLEEQAQALQTTLGLVNSSVDPFSVNPVSACIRYGKRGALVDFVKHRLQAAGARGLYVSELRDDVALHFRLSLPLPKDRLRMGETIREALRRLNRLGLVEAVAEKNWSNSPTLWRWKASTALADLRALANAQASGHDPPVDAAGGQVDRQ